MWRDEEAIRKTIEARHESVPPHLLDILEEFEGAVGSHALGFEYNSTDAEYEADNIQLDKAREALLSELAELWEDGRQGDS